MRRLLTTGAAALLSAFLVFANPGSACACSCVEVTDAAAFAEADAVFTGTLRGSDEHGFPHPESVTLEFAVDEVYKGEVSEVQGVLTSAADASCGWLPPEGEAYLVYASEEGGQLWARLCGGSRELEGTPPAFDAEGGVPIPGADDLAGPEAWPYGAAAALLLAATAAAWWLLRRRHLRSV